VDRKKVVDGRAIRKGDVVLGLASSGFHSNGYSLLRKLFTEDDLRGKLGAELLTPTRIYVKPVLKLLQKVPLNGIVNITGGGFVDNIPRVLPKGLGVTIKKGSWRRPKIFDLVQDSGNISDLEMSRTFNLGIGMVLILKAKDAKQAERLLKTMKIPSWVIGEVVKSKERVEIIE
jgi:phosphoribosylformylglycinamidine cyclo-ligase